MNRVKDEEGVHVPIIIGNYFPFRLVLRDNEEWNPSLDEINYSNYDYVKLSRISKFIDADIAPYTLGIGFDGSLILPAIPKFLDREVALNKFNEILGRMLLGGIYFEAIQPLDIYAGSLFYKGYFHGLGGEGQVAKFYQSIRMQMAGRLDVIKLMDPTIIRTKEIEKAYLDGKKIFNKLPGLSANLLLDGTSHYVKKQWAESLIFLWTCIEQVINIIWVNEIANFRSDSKIIGRKEFLKDFRTWTSSAKIELLFQKQFIDNSVYELLNSARKVRNEFIHKGVKLDEKKVYPSLSGLFKIISLIISSYKNSSKLDSVLNAILTNQKGRLYSKKRVLKKDEIKFWMYMPALPGSKAWGNKEYEIIEELVLKPMNKTKTGKKSS